MRGQTSAPSPHRTAKRYEQQAMPDVPARSQQRATAGQHPQHQHQHQQQRQQGSTSMSGHTHAQWSPPRTPQQQQAQQYGSHGSAEASRRPHARTSSSSSGKSPRASRKMRSSPLRDRVRGPGRANTDALQWEDVIHSPAKTPVASSNPGSKPGSSRPTPVEKQPAFRNHQPAYPGTSPKTFYATSVAHPSQQGAGLVPAPRSPYAAHQQQQHHHQQHHHHQHRQAGRPAPPPASTAATAPHHHHHHPPAHAYHPLYQPPKMLQYSRGAASSPSPSSPMQSTDDLRRFEAAEIKYLQDNLLAARRDLIDAHKQLDVTSYKLSGALMSINYFWAPELDKVRKRLQIEKQQREAAEVLLKEHEIKAHRQSAQINNLKASLNELLSATAQRDDLHSELQQMLSFANTADTRMVSDVDDDDNAWIDPSPLLADSDIHRRLSRSQAQVGQLQLRIRELEEMNARLKASTAVSADADGEQAAADTHAREAGGDDDHDDGVKIPFVRSSSSTAAAAAAATSRLEAELEVKKEAIEKLEETVRDLERRLERETDETSALRQHADSITADRDRLLRELEQMADSQAAASEEHSTREIVLQHQVDELNQQLRTAETKIATLEHERGVGAAEAEQLRSDMAAQTREGDEAIHTLKEALASARVALSSVREEKDELLARIDDMREEADTRQRDATAGVDDIRRKLAAAEEERDELRRTVSSLQAQADDNADMQATLTSLEEELKEVRSSHRAKEEDLQGELADLSREAHAQQEQIRSLEHELAALRAQNQQLSTEKESESDQTSAELAAVRAQNTELTRDVQQLKQSLSTAEQRVADLTAAKSRLAQELEDAVAEKDKIAKKHERARKRLQEVEAETQAQLSKREHDHSAAMAALRLEFEAAEGARTRAETKARTHERKARKAAEDLADARKELEAKAAAVETLTATNADIKREMKQLRRQFSSQREELVRAQKQLAAAQEKATQDQQQHSEKAKQHEANMTTQQQQLSNLQRKYAALEKEKAEASSAAASAHAQVREMGQQLSDVLSSKLQAERTARQLQADLDDKSRAVQDLTQQVRDLSNKIIFEKINVLLLRIEDKDSRIAALEMQGADRHRDEIERLRREQKEELAALKEQYKKRQALDAYDEANGSSQQPVVDRDTLIETLEIRQTEARRFRRYIDQLLGEVLQQDSGVQTSIMTGLPRLQQDEPVDPASFPDLSTEELKEHVHKQEEDNNLLETYINELLKRIVEHRPSILEVMAFTTNGMAMS
ncbi:hypothetical protein PTSG_07538 [Salpingoeca rosetta]|uniref:FIP-RBD domain-containing protein n=1 Tax=Salpingoeca rosetta (strain ATCC 50818 / BSB-021) TaxID=946362 RepID=F2UH20_SALR5|nr:uncharacterized protein PTSG_07538 [Salpingoeca rosetta]EGD76419.1 hypothetical protein PTSG_07538 [Salpingoeca rosetta]|eukprot:XP_004991334.1 hypothetical protein PTSG_07538 [Salpingoeca rosetta]